jgi:flagellar motor component MotA
VSKEGANDELHTEIELNPVFKVTDRLLKKNEAIVEGKVLFASLKQDDKLYVYNEEFQLMNAAKIQGMTSLESEEVIRLAPQDETAKLTLELAKSNMGPFKYISTHQSLDFLKSYLR